MTTKIASIHLIRPSLRREPRKALPAPFPSAPKRNYLKTTRPNAFLTVKSNSMTTHSQDKAPADGFKIAKYSVPNFNI